MPDEVELPGRLTRLMKAAGGPTLETISKRAATLVVPGGPTAPKVPTISGWRTGRALPDQWESLKLVLDALIEMAQKRGTPPDPPDLYKIRKWKVVYNEAQRRATAPVTTAVYQGLAAYQRDDADRFYGRDTEIVALAELLDRTALKDPGIVAVVAPSGAGKSSLLQAGLLPRLAKQGLESLPGSESWPTLVITPGQHPLTALTREIPALTECVSTSEETAALIAPPEQVRAAVTSYLTDRSGAGARLILIVDQFEEVFTLANEAERQAFIDLLQAMSETDAANPSPALVVLGMRADFSQSCFGYPPLVDALQNRQRLLPAMTIPQLREVIERPPEAAGVKVEPPLVQMLLQDAGLADADGSATGRSDAGVLPLVSHALRITWDKRRGQRGQVTAQAYLDAGRLRGAVEQTADGAWNELTEQQQAAGLWLLLSLVHIGDNPSRDTRNPREWRELIDNAADRAATQQARDVLVRERLITADTDTVQITHEALMRSWPRLAEAINKHRDGLAWRQRVGEAAAAWEQSRDPRWWRRIQDARDSDHLWRGAQLSAALEWQETATALDQPTAPGAQFLRRSARTRLLKKCGVVGVIGILSLTALTALAESVAATRESNNAVFTQVVAEADRLRSTDVSLAAQLYLTAYRMRPTPALYTSLLETENVPLSQPLPTPHMGIVRTVAANGSTLASAADDGTIQLWATGTAPTLNSQIHETGHVTGLALSSDGATVASAQDDGADPEASTIQLWNIADPRHPTAHGAALPAHIGHIWAIALSPDGKILAGAGGDGLTRLWSVTDPAHPTPIGGELAGSGRMLYGTGITFSPDGRTLAVGGDGGTVRMWNVTDPAAPVSLTPLIGGSRVTYAVAFSHNRNIMVTGGGDTVMRIWDVTDPARAVLLNQPVTTPGSSILSIAVSPDGNTVAAATADNSVRLWNIAEAAHPIPLGAPLTGHTRGIGAIAFSPDGHTLITGSADATVRLWALPPTQLVGAQGNVTSVVFSHNGRTLAVAGADAVRLWDTTAPTEPVQEGPSLHQDGAVNSVAFNRDDTVLASGGHSQAVRLWNVTDPRNTTQLGPDLTFVAEVGGVAISPDGQTLAVGCGDGTIRLFTLTDPAHPQPVGPVLASTPNKLVGTVHFSPDGKVLASAGADHQIWLWNVADPAGAHPLGPPLARHTDQIYQLTFSPDGHTLGSVGADHTARLWNVTDPAHAAEIGPPLQQQTNAVGGVSYSPDGNTLATGSDDKTVVLWNVTDPAHGTTIGHPITGHTNFIYTVGFSPDSKTLASGGRDHIVLLWQLDVERAIQRICQTSAANLDPAAWNTYVSNDRNYSPPCRA